MDKGGGRGEILSGPSYSDHWRSTGDILQVV